jgi:Mg2+-importing ATPase
MAHVFKFAPLPLAYFPWWAAMIGGYIVLTQVVKTWYLKRYGWQ